MDNKNGDNLYSSRCQDEYIISPGTKVINNSPRKINLAILASGHGSNFEALINSIKQNHLNAEIKVLIVNVPGCGAIEKALKHNIKYVLLDNHKFPNRKAHEIEILRILSHYSIDLIVMAGWMRIVSNLLIENYTERIINIHPSILPSFKGSKAIQDALNQAVKITGCTVHIVQKEVDSGEIIIQGAVAIDSNDNIDTLTSKIHKIEHIILPKAIEIMTTRINKY